MFKYLLLVFCCLYYVCSKAQTGFFKTYDFGTVEYIYQVLEYNSRIYINTATWCGVECSFLSEIDLNGNILWRTEIPDIDIALGTMVIGNDTITITGNSEDNKSFLMAHFSLNGEKIGETIKIEHASTKFTNMFQLTTQLFNNKYIICGTGKLMNNVYYSLIYVVSKDGSLDTLITLNKSNNTSIIWDSFIDAQGLLTTLHWVESDDFENNFRNIYKFDENFDIVWSYQTENNSSNQTIPRGCELIDGRTVLAYINPEGDPSLYSIRAISPDADLDWQYDYQWTGSSTREIYKLKTLRNGDILGSGQYSEFEQNPRVGDSPWLFRMRPEGELLWEHVYYEFDLTLPPNGSSRIGALLDFAELENGDILAVGTIKYNDSDMLVIRVDSNGCLFDDNCSDSNISTSTEEVSVLQKQLSIYPNLTTDIINVELDTKEYILQFEVRDVAGVIRLNGKITETSGQINVSNLQAGMYFINLMNKNQLAQIGKFIKI